MFWNISKSYTLNGQNLNIMTLQEWIPDGTSFINKETKKHLDKEVKKEYSSVTDTYNNFYEKLYSRTTFTQNHIHYFVELEDGTLVAHNENPSHGWSFPTGKWKNGYEGW